ncbi:TIGR03088 family PEP-CTERM/XrtA system glycosyltransferase [Chitinimonas sp. PSY-7]|uniref:TIGR03088 family PEP-CTERM/XrtA system glycosyltransferase n=1 Tax=Chitinimonas sp. PSY-7 TaxID=3459088 RepID=UPI00403FFD91
MTSPADIRPLVAHVVYRFDVGGLENGVVNLINRMPLDSYRHVVIALTEVTDFRYRICRDDVECIALAKPPGHALRIYPQLYRLFRQLQPTIVHSRNLAALEAQVPAWFAGVKVRVHGEHGRDVDDLDGSSRKYQWLRRCYRPFVTHYIALSRDLADYLTQRVGVPTAKVTQIYNGVDAGKFLPATHRKAIEGCPFTDPAHYLVGTVGRMQTVKDQTNLAKAFIRVLQKVPALKARLRLVLVGDGPLREQVIAMLTKAGVADLAWLPGGRSDVADILQGLDCFVLPSLAEGVSNTILEAMASGLPVIATEVGGNAELLEPGESGFLVPAADPESLANAILHYARSPDEGHAAGRHGRQLIERRFSLEAMVGRYQQLYDQLRQALNGAAGALPVQHSPQPPIND